MIPTTKKTRYNRRTELNPKRASLRSVSSISLRGVPSSFWVGNSEFFSWALVRAHAVFGAGPSYLDGVVNK